jgi:hypothetical protein
MLSCVALAGRARQLALRELMRSPPCSAAHCSAQAMAVDRSVTAAWIRPEPRRLPYHPTLYEPTASPGTIATK